MYLFYVFLVHVVWFAPLITADVCQSDDVKCNHTCATSNQILLEIYPATVENTEASCTLLSGVANKCCLLKRRHAHALNSEYQNWCCEEVKARAVLQNIKDVSYIVNPPVEVKRSVEGMCNSRLNLHSLDRKNTKKKTPEPTPSPKEHTPDPAVDAVLKDLKKVYPDAVIHPEAAKKYLNTKQKVAQRQHEQRETRLKNMRRPKAPKPEAKAKSVNVPVPTKHSKSNPAHHKRSVEDQEGVETQSQQQQQQAIVTAEPNKEVTVFYTPYDRITSRETRYTKYENAKTFNGEWKTKEKEKAQKRASAQTDAPSDETNITDDDYGEPFPVVYNILEGSTVQDITFGWNLDRIDERTLPLDHTYTPVNAGLSQTSTPIHVYVVDTGIIPDHDAFRTVTVSMDYPSALGARDCHGHGTHVASTVAGVASGVLANTPQSDPSDKYDVVLHAVRVLDCSGSGSLFDVIDGLLWVYDNVQYPAIVTMSLGSSRSITLDNVVSSLITDKDIPVIAAAGNSNTDACNTSPAGGPGVIAVGSTSTTDARSSFSNYGTCVSVYAPGENVLGAYYLSSTDYFYLSGTSMATPQVTGSISAYTLQYEAGGSAPNVAVHGLSKFLANRTNNVVTGSLGGGVNRFCYVGTGAPNVPAPTTSSPPPVSPPPSSSGGPPSRLASDSSVGSLGSSDIFKSIILAIMLIWWTHL
jgi:hypothetical protein